MIKQKLFVLFIILYSSSTVMADNYECENIAWDREQAHFELILADAPIQGYGEFTFKNNTDKELNFHAYGTDNIFTVPSLEIFDKRNDQAHFTYDWRQPLKGEITSINITPGQSVKFYSQIANASFRKCNYCDKGGVGFFTTILSIEGYYVYSKPYCFNEKP